MKPPTKAQQRVLKAMRIHLRRNHNVPPTLRGLGRRLDLHHTTVLEHLKALHARGLVRQYEGDGRYTLADGVSHFLPRAQKRDRTKKNKR